jgi:protein TonB
MEKGVFNIELPEIGKDEKLVQSDIVEIPSPPPPPKKGSKEEVFSIVEEMPVYKNGGMYRLAMDIKELTSSIMKKISDRGEAIVGFTVAADGSVVNPQVVQSSNNKALDVSAIEIIQKLDNWNPGIQRGKKVPVDLTVPVKFE